MFARVFFATAVFDAGLFLPSSLFAGPRPIYVDQSASGTGEGSSWTNAFTTIGAGLAAATSGAEVFAADGTYEEASSSLNPLVNLIGGFEGGGGAEETSACQA